MCQALLVTEDIMVRKSPVRSVPSGGKAGSKWMNAVGHRDGRGKERLCKGGSNTWANHWSINVSLTGRQGQKWGGAGHSRQTE